MDKSMSPRSGRRKVAPGVSRGSLFLVVVSPARGERNPVTFFQRS